MGRQMSLFEEAPPALDGFRYRADLFGPAEEQELAARVQELPFAPFEFHGFTGKRRTVSYGWRYVFDGSGLARTDPIPGFLLPLRAAAAAFAGIAPEALENALVTDYPPGATIGWHKDRSVFGVTIGISLLTPCTLRFRRRSTNGWDRVSVPVEARSVYLLSGASRGEWEHSIAALASRRYSITFRTMAGR